MNKKKDNEKLIESYANKNTKHNKLNRDEKSNGTLLMIIGIILAIVVFMIIF